MSELISLWLHEYNADINNLDIVDNLDGLNLTQICWRTGVYEYLARGCAWRPIEENLRLRWRAQVMISQFLKNLKEKKIALAFQAIYLVEEREQGIIYYEATVRQVKSEKWVSCFEEIRSMEDLGYIAWFDILVVHAIIDLLNENPDVHIGCNVSGRSLRMTLGWHKIFMRLRDRRDIARRLVFEITETSPLMDVDEAVSLIQTLRFFGCRVAMDDVGNGYFSLAFLRGCQIDIVKLDRTLLISEKKYSEGNAGLLGTAIQMFSHLSQYVVIEGVEDAEMMSAAVKAGGHGVQGFFLEKPSLTPEWLSFPIFLSGHHPYADFYTELGEEVDFNIE